MQKSLITKYSLKSVILTHTLSEGAVALYLLIIVGLNIDEF